LAGLKFNVRLELGTESALSLDAIGRSRGYEITMADAGRVKSTAERTAVTDFGVVEVTAVAVNGGIQTQLGTFDTNLANRQGLTVGPSQATMQAGLRIARRKRQ